MDVFFIVVSTIAFVSGIVWMLASVGALAALVSRILPLLTETRENIQELGDLSANTVGRAADTMELVELRVSQTMGSAVQAGVSVRKQALSVGTALAGVYMATRVISALRQQFGSAKPDQKSNKSRQKRKQQHVKL